MFFRLFFALSLALLVSRFASAADNQPSPKTASEVPPEIAVKTDSEVTTPLESPQGKPIELGLNLQVFIPNSVRGLDLPIPLWGPHIGLPIGSNTLELQAFYGSNEGASSLFLGETNFRWNIVTPFITGYALLGLHYLRFRADLQSHNFFGPLTGFGFYFPMARNFKMGLGMKIYLPQKTILEFGGGFAFLI